MIEEYIEAFRRRSTAMAGPQDELVDADGIVGALARGDESTGGRLLIIDDRALPVLRELGPGVPAGVITVLAEAKRCTELLISGGAEPQAASAMVCRDLAVVPELALPPELTLRRVRRRPEDEPDGVPVAAAAAACLRAESVPDEAIPGFVAFLTSLPPSSRLFAATDAAGAVRATAAYGRYGEDVNVFFVSTDPAWRGRGIASAMTAGALRAGREQGGVRACLDATRAGFGIYRRLGFDVAGTVTMFFGMGGE